MGNIPLPPVPDLSNIQVFFAAVICLFLGIGLLIKGRHYGRAILCTGGIFTGLILGGWLAEEYSQPLLFCRIVSCVIFAMVGLFFARFVWALLAGMVFGSVAIWIILSSYLPIIPVDSQPMFQVAEFDFMGWTGAFIRYCFDAIAVLFPQYKVIILSTVLPSLLFPIAIGSAYGRVGKVVMTSVSGAVSGTFSSGDG